MSRTVLSTGTPAELALPADGRSPTGGLLLWPDIGGLRPLFDAHARRLADEHGWAVCAVELFPGNESMPIEARLTHAATFDDGDKLADAEAAADLIAGHLPDGAPIRVLGFCMGGMYAMKTLANTRFDRAVAFYGMVRVPEAWAGGGQGDALDVVAANVGAGRRAGLLCIFGTEDPWCPLAEIDEVEAAGATVVRYEGADHGWAQDPDRENFRPADADDAWERAEAYLSGT